MRIRILAATAAFTAGLVAITGNSLAAASTKAASNVSMTASTLNLTLAAPLVADVAQNNFMQFTAAPDKMALATNNSSLTAARAAPATTETMKAAIPQAAVNSNFSVYQAARAAPAINIANMSAATFYNTATTAAARAAPMVKTTNVAAPAATQYVANKIGVNLNAGGADFVGYRKATATAQLDKKTAVAWAARAAPAMQSTSMITANHASA